MKKISIIIITAIITAPNIALGIICPGERKCIVTSNYMTASECQETCTSGTYCCPACYEEATEETCPDGWILTTGLPMIGGGTAGNTCTRTDNTIVAEDTKGYKKQNYGSCNPTNTPTNVLWYKISSTNEPCNGMNVCARCGN